jgi:hypothetical protein
MAAEFETEFAVLDGPVRLELLAQVRRLKSLERERTRVPLLAGASAEELRELCVAVPTGEWRAAVVFDEPREVIVLLACESSEHGGNGREWILSDKAERRLRRYFARVLPYARRAAAG